MISISKNKKVADITGKPIFMGITRGSIRSVTGRLLSENNFEIVMKDEKTGERINIEFLDMGHIVSRLIDIPAGSRLKISISYQQK